MSKNVNRHANQHKIKYHSWIEKECVTKNCDWQRADAPVEGRPSCHLQSQGSIPGTAQLHMGGALADDHSGGFTWAGWEFLGGARQDEYTGGGAPPGLID